MNTYLISIRFGTEEWEQYATAATIADAIEAVRKTLPSNVRRWANVFAG